jgi:hypothetical protein
MKFKPVYEYQDNRDGRGHSIRYSHQRDMRRRARKKAEKLMGKSYFTNPQEIIFKEMEKSNVQNKFS